MKYNIYRPNNYLSGFVKVIWSMEFEHADENLCSQTIIPTGCVELLFHYGQRTISRKLNGSEQLNPLGVIDGQKTTYSEILSKGKIGIISVMIRPEVANIIMGFPVNELTDQSLDVIDVFGKYGKELIEEVNERKCFEDKIRAIENFLMQRIIVNRFTVNPRIRECVKQLTLSGGNIKIENLAEQTNISRRQLERDFLTVLGLTPKNFSKVVRFQKVLSLKQSCDKISMTELSYRCGYSDQAHLINDFKSFSGLTPKSFFAECQPFSDYYSYL